jgi:NAD(P)H-dependent flavin oxidoreductase YrpB (nitropropane dioxygenase family)
MFSNGETETGILACGQAIGLVHDILPVKELLDRIMKQAEELSKKLAS